MYQTVVGYNILAYGQYIFRVGFRLIGGAPRLAAPLDPNSRFETCYCVSLRASPASPRSRSTSSPSSRSTRPCACSSRDPRRESARQGDRRNADGHFGAKCNVIILPSSYQSQCAAHSPRSSCLPTPSCRRRRHLCDNGKLYSGDLHEVLEKSGKGATSLYTT